MTDTRFDEECDINVLVDMGDAFGPRSTRRFAPHRATLGCLGPSGNDRYRKRSLRSQTVGGFASQLPSRGGSFAMNRADVFGQALLEDPPQ